jgi:uncharacterized protein YeaO (DUF488 family)
MTAEVRPMRRARADGRRDSAGKKGRVDIRVKRAYEAASRDDGHRVLVDGLWPRGLSRDQARIDEWARELAPSDALRHWYQHDTARFDEFRRRYVRELDSRRKLLTELRKRARAGRVTLVFAARNVEHSNAAVLASVLRAGLR